MRTDTHTHARTNRPRKKWVTKVKYEPNLKAGTVSLHDPVQASMQPQGEFEQAPKFY